MKQLILVLSLLLSQVGVTAEPATEIVVALKPDKNPETMLKERAALEKVLSEKLGQKVKVVVPLSGAVIQEGLANGTVDLAFVSGLEMLKLENTNAAELMLAVQINGKTSYESYWVALKDKPYNKVQDLKGKPVTFASRTSTSGYLIPVYDLVKKKALPAKADPKDYFGEVNFGTGYVSAIERVLSGQVEAAAVSDYVINKDKHLTPEQKEKLKVVAKQGPVPTHILAVRKSLDAKSKLALEKALLSLNEHPELRDQVFTAKLVKTSVKKQLGSLKEALKLTGISID